MIYFGEYDSLLCPTSSGVCNVLQFRLRYYPAQNLSDALSAFPKGTAFLLNGANLTPTPIISGARMVVGDYFIYLAQHNNPSDTEFFKNTVVPRYQALVKSGSVLTYPAHVLEYWNAPDEQNNPESYLRRAKNEKPTEYLFSLIQKHCPSVGSILELGCNCGHNMAYLKARMDVGIDGIELNGEAIKLLREEYPCLSKSEIFHGNMIDVIGAMDAQAKYDLIFSKAALMHLHPTTVGVFWDQLARLSGKYLLTIELESCGSDRAFGRNYKDIFLATGFSETFSELVQDDATGIRGYQTRIFKRD